MGQLWTCHILRGGRRMVLAFHRPGEQAILVMNMDNIEWNYDFYEEWEDNSYQEWEEKKWKEEEWSPKSAEK